MAALEPGATAPAFELESLDGKRHSLRELSSGDLLLLAFYHRTCPTCQFSAPAIGAIARAVAAPTVRVWGISQDPEDESAQFANEKRLGMPILIDEPPYKVSAAYGLTNVPTLFVIDGRRRIVKTCVGFSKADFLDIAALLAKHAALEQPSGIFATYREVPAFKPG
jgi:peroxiredoxin